MSKECPFCKKHTSDFLQHLSIQHEIKSADDYAKKMNILSENKHKKEEFANYVEKLKKMKHDGEITSEKYRELITEWLKENRGHN